MDEQPKTDNDEKVKDNPFADTDMKAKDNPFADPSDSDDNISTEAPNKKSAPTMMELIRELRKDLDSDDDPDAPNSAREEAKANPLRFADPINYDNTPRTEGTKDGYSQSVIDAIQESIGKGKGPKHFCRYRYTGPDDWKANYDPCADDNSNTGAMSSKGGDREGYQQSARVMAMKSGKEMDTKDDDPEGDGGCGSRVDGRERSIDILSDFEKMLGPGAIVEVTPLLRLRTQSPVPGPSTAPEVGIFEPKDPDVATGQAYIAEIMQKEPKDKRKSEKLGIKPLNKGKEVRDKSMGVRDSSPEARDTNLHAPPSTGSSSPGLQSRHVPDQVAPWLESEIIKTVRFLGVNDPVSQ